MTTHKAGTILLLDFPNTDGAQSKPRPVLVVLDTGDDDVLIAPITSHAPRTSFGLSIVDWAAAGLRLASTIRMNKLATQKKSKIRHAIGTLASVDRKSVSAALNSMFGNW